MSAPPLADKPVLAVDVDGVISLFGFEGPAEEAPCRFQLIDGTAHCISLAAGERLRRLIPFYELIWATGWEDRANDYLLHLLGLAPLPVLRFGRSARFGSAHWKLGPIGDYATRPTPRLDRRLPRRELLRVGASARRADAARPDPLPRGAGGLTRRCPDPLGRRQRRLDWHRYMDEGLATMIFMGLILKIPVVAACWLIWHAVRSEPEPASSEDTGGEQPHRYFRREPSARADPAGGRTHPMHCPSPVRRGEEPARPRKRLTPDRVGRI